MAEDFNFNISFDHVVPLKITKVNNSSNGIILGLHGYAQMADSMVKYLEYLAGDLFDYCSLQAPHIFTTPNNTYVSTWMNRINREDHVAYQIQYFNELNRQLEQFDYNEAVKIGFGFSQGASSLYRMIFLSSLDVKLAIIYAGDIPPEIKNMDRSKIELIKTKFVLVHGEKDNVMTAEKVKADYDWLKENNLLVDLIKYEGKHTIDLSVLNSLSSWIQRA